MLLDVSGRGNWFPSVCQDLGHNINITVGTSLQSNLETMHSIDAEANDREIGSGRSYRCKKGQLQGKSLWFLFWDPRSASLTPGLAPREAFWFAR